MIHKYYTIPHTLFLELQAPNITMSVVLVYPTGVSLPWDPRQI